MSLKLITPDLLEWINYYSKEPYLKDLTDHHTAKFSPSDKISTMEETPLNQTHSHYTKKSKSLTTKPQDRDQTVNSLILDSQVSHITLKTQPLMPLTLVVFKLMLTENHKL